MERRRTQFTAQELAAGSPDYRRTSVSPSPNGNRAERRAWAKLTKTKNAPAVDRDGEVKR